MSTLLEMNGGETYLDKHNIFTVCGLSYKTRTDMAPLDWMGRLPVP